MKLLILLVILNLNLAFSKDYVIYSIEHKLPMNDEQTNQELEKNYYVNLGKGQGIIEGTELEVFRTISVLNSFDDQERTTHKIKIGKLKVIHTEDRSSIAIAVQDTKEQKPIVEINHFMLGDKVNISIRN